MRVLLAALTVLIFGCATTNPDETQSFRHRINIQALSKTTSEDIKAEIKFGRDVAARVVGKYSLLKDKTLNRYVNLIGTALAAHSSRTELNYYFAILDTDTVNAYSTPGGYIFITRGALTMAKDEAELAGILAHEIAHITERHIVNSLNIKAKDTSSSAGLGRLLSAGSETTRVAFMQAIDKAVTILFEKGYSQQDELNSDRTATLLLAESGYDPLALRRYLERVEKSDQNKHSINTTHPPSKSRLRTLDRIIEEEKFDHINLSQNIERFQQHVKAK